MIRRPPRSTQSRSSAASDVYKRQRQYIQSYEGEKQIKVYSLETVKFPLRRYCGILDFFLSFYKDFLYLNFNLFYSLKAMSIHKSQFVWFRKLFVLFSRYTYLNNLNPII
eukprot:TRINITY_DN9106_c0_g1_i1.p2 TRINITY_DN9106_c0_g1~~TRINITY_DN9106_c0_g1_i1.p2  ORF type:complete len:110 (-),score=34.40 TRINITY_DN9106_c0_g1_i1:184-513(-)